MMMDPEQVKQRNRRRRRAQCMQAQREANKAEQREGGAGGRVQDSGDDDDDDDQPLGVKEKPHRPLHARRKKNQLSREPLVEEDIVEGFSILQFRTYEELELVLKISTKENIKRLSDIEKLVERQKLEPKVHNNHHISLHTNHALPLTQDLATSDDSGRASERLTGSSVAPRECDSSRDRLSDASSRCSSGKGYICDSEGEDDKGSDASSVIFASTPASRKREFPGALPPSLPLSNGTSNSPVPAPTPPNLPVPSPAPAQQPPLHPPVSAPATSGDLPVSCAAGPPQLPPPPPVVPVTAMTVKNDMEAATTVAAAPQPPPGHHPFVQQQPLYTPYAVHTPTSLPPSAASATAVTAASTAVVKATSASPRGCSPSTRESNYSNVSSLSRSSVTTPHQQQQQQYGPNTIASSSTPTSSLNIVKHATWTSASATSTGPGGVSSVSAASATSQTHQQQAPRPTPPPQPTISSNFPPPIFATPLPPTTRASPLATNVAQQPHPPNPFSAENLFQTNQADMLRRELDNRFLASQDRGMGVAPPYLRTEMHQHQHHHTHVHQHTTSLLAPPSGSSLFPSPMNMSPLERLERRSASSFKDIPKLGGVDSSPFYRQNLGMPSYPAYTPSLLHPGLTTGPFVAPNHLPTFQPKSIAPEPPKPKAIKSGKWNAMHVRVAWEIYHHQQKSGDSKPPPASAKDLLRPPTNLFGSSRPPPTHDLSPFSPHRTPNAYDQPPAPHQVGSLFAAPPNSHLKYGPPPVANTSPFTRYGSYAAGPGGPPHPPPNFGMSPLALGGLHPHDPWRGLQRTVPTFTPAVNALPPTLPGLAPQAPWSIKPDPMLEREREEREREKLRREREERERREREEKQRRLEQERREKERREMERREMERERERERERLLHQQRLDSVKHGSVSTLRDRSPIRNGQPEMNDVRVKEEPRKEDDLMARTSDPRYHHPFLRHPGTASRMLPPPPLGHYAPPPQPPTASHWPPPPGPHPDFYHRYDPLRYNPLMDVMRAEEERCKLYSAYAAQQRKDLMHLRAPQAPPPPSQAHKMVSTPQTDVHKKEESR